LGQGDRGYKFLKKVFAFKPNQFLFKWFHPDLGTALGLFFSHRSRLSNIAKQKIDKKELPMEEEMLFQYALKKAKMMPQVNYFIFGHRHIPVQIKIKNSAELIILGDWISHFTYGVLHNGNFELRVFEGE